MMCGPRQSALVVALFCSMAAAVGGCSGTPAISYNSLIQEVKAGNVESMDFTSETIRVVLADAPQAGSGPSPRELVLNRSTLSEDQMQQLLDLLREHGVDFTVQQSAHMTTQRRSRVYSHT